MPLPVKPLSVIGAVVTRRVGDPNRVHGLLGTAFLVDDRLFMSAHHVFGVIPPLGQELAVVSLGTDQILAPAAYQAQVIYQDAKHDIAIARVTEWTHQPPLLIAESDDLMMNSNVLTVEFSRTRSGVPLQDGRTAMELSAGFHKGYIIRDYITGFGYSAPTHCIDLSYPALKGASGAPVIEESSGLVLGMITANTEQQLMPAHIERTERPDGTRDEIIRYFLPSGQAVMASHLREALSQVPRSERPSASD